MVKTQGRPSPEQEAASKERLQQIIDRQKAERDSLLECKKEYTQLREFLEELPMKLSHQVMVPLGSMAFFEGEITHTNEIMTFVGNDWFVERTAANSLKTVDHRVKLIDEKLHVLDSGLTRMGAVKHTSTASDDPIVGARMNDEGYIEITEKYEEDEEETGGKAVSTEVRERDPKFMDRLKYLESLEGDDEYDDSAPVASPPAAAPAPQRQIRGPGDLYSLMGGVEEKAEEAQTTVREVKEAPRAAFSGAIGERVVEAQAAPQQVTEEAPKRVSRFRRDRMGQ